MFRQAVTLYESGMTQVEVAHTLNTTQKVIWSLFKRNNYKCRIAKKRNQFRENNSSWNQNSVNYATLHYRVSAVRGKKNKCVMCESYVECEWANVSGNYLNIYDYIRLCLSCHSIFDNKYKNIS